MRQPFYLQRAIEPTSRMWVVVFLLLANVYDPGGTLGIKYAAAVVALVATVVTLRWFDLSLGELMVGIGILAVWPAWSLLYGLLSGAEPAVAFSQVTPFLFAPVLAGLIRTADGDLPVRMFYWCMFSLAIFVVLLFGFLGTAPESGISSTIVAFLSKYTDKQGFFGDWVESPVIYFRATLFLVPTFIYFILTGRIWRSLVILLALALSFSKSGVVICLGFAVLSLFVAPRSHATSWSSGVFGRAIKILPYAAMGLLAAVLFLSFRGLGEEVWAAATADSETAQLRVRHIESVLELFQRNPDYLLTGQGAGSTFFSAGYNTKLVSMEVDHLDTIRKFGLPWFIAFSLLIFRIGAKLIRRGDQDGRAAGFALFGSYLASGTNPVFISPLFIMLIVASYFAQRKEKDFVG